MVGEMNYREIREANRRKERRAEVKRFLIRCSYAAVLVAGIVIGRLI